MLNNNSNTYAIVFDQALFDTPEAIFHAFESVKIQAGQFQWPLFQSSVEQALLSKQAEFFLVLDANGWNAYWTTQPLWNGLFFDYTLPKALRRLAQAGPRSEGLIKSLGRKKAKLVLDCTAGSGQESLLLASSGAQVVALERHPLIYILLQDAIARAKRHPVLATLGDRLSVLHKDAYDYICSASRQEFDVIYCDPMFPARNKSALVSKTMQLFQAIHHAPTQFEHGLSQEEQSAKVLVQRALSTAKQRVIVKRPAKAPPILNTPKPSQSVQNGRLVRFDIYQLG